MTRGGATYFARAERPPSFFTTVWADLQGMADMKGAKINTPSGLIDTLMLPGTMAVFLFRLSSLCYAFGLKPISRLLYILNVVLFGTSMPPGTQVGPGLVVPHPVATGFSQPVVLGRNVHILAAAALGGSRTWDEKSEGEGFPVVGDGCWIFTGAKVLGNIRLGENVLVGPSSLLMKSVPAGAIVLGNPARIIGYREGYEPKEPGTPR